MLMAFVVHDGLAHLVGAVFAADVALLIPFESTLVGVGVPGAVTLAISVRQSFAMIQTATDDVQHVHAGRALVTRGFVPFKPGHV